MEITEFLKKYEMTIHEFIDMIKRKGEVVTLKNNVFGISDDKYVERVVLFFDDHYFVTYMVLDDYILKCYWEDAECYPREFSAIDAYYSLNERLNIDNIPNN